MEELFDDIQCVIEKHQRNPIMDLPDLVDDVCMLQAEFLHNLLESGEVVLDVEEWIEFHFEQVVETLFMLEMHKDVFVR